MRRVQLAHNHCVDGVTRAEVLVNLDRGDRLHSEGLRRLVASFNRHLGEPDDGGVDVRAEVGDAMTVVGSRGREVGTSGDGHHESFGVSTPFEAVHVRAECALRDHPSLRRWIRQLRSGRRRIDTAKVRAEERVSALTSSCAGSP